MRSLYKKIKILSNKGIRKIQPIKNKQGKLLTSTSEQTERWKEHFSELSSTPDVGPPHEESNTRSSRRITQTPPSAREIAKCIRILKNNKVEGIDGIPAEWLKANAEVTARILEPIMKKIWNNESISANWKKGIIIKLPKKGDLTECRNWRGITLLNCTNKILALILYYRIVDVIEESLREEQAGFRRERGCIDQSNTLRHIVEQ